MFYCTLQMCFKIILHHDFGIFSMGHNVFSNADRIGQTNCLKQNYDFLFSDKTFFYDATKMSRDRQREKVSMHLFHFLT